MSAVHAAVMASAVGGASAGFSVTNSGRWRAANSANATRTPGVAGDRQKHKGSVWIKRGALDTDQYIYTANNAGTIDGWRFLSANNALRFLLNDGTNGTIDTPALFRDGVGHGHLYWEFDSTQAVAADRLKVWWNGTSLALTYTTNITLNYNSAIHNTVAHYIGRNPVAASGFFDGLFSQFQIVDGNASGFAGVVVGSFGEVPPATNYWVPKLYTGAYGTCGCYLEFKDASSTANLLKDTSGNSNNWTPSGFSIAANSTFDQFTDTPTNNFATLLPLATPVIVTFRNANMEFCGLTNAAHRTACASITLPPTGNWYWEVTAARTDSNEMIGIVDLLGGTTNLPASGTEIGKRGAGVFDYGYRSDSGKWSQNSTSAYGVTFTAGDVIGVNWNSDAQTLTFYKNNVSQGVAYSGIAQQAGRFAPASSTAESSVYEAYNFGQRPFVYTPPSGALPLNAANLVSAAVLLSGSFTGNAAADGPVVFINGNPATLTINGNAVTFGTHADKLAGGFKLRTSSASYNASGTNNWTATAGNRFVSAAKIPNQAQANP